MKGCRPTLGSRGRARSRIGFFSLPPFPSITHYVQQTHFFLSSPHLGTQEFECVREAFATNWIAPLGPHVDQFEKEFGQILQEGTELTEIGRKEAQKAQKS